MPDKPDKATVAEEAAITAAVSAEHAVSAADQAATDEAKAQKAANKATPDCPHCGRRLRAENDLGDHLHCDGANCVECCFDPGDPPTLRPNLPDCPSAPRKV
jgi:hypothetical protein